MKVLLFLLVLVLSCSTPITHNERHIDSVLDENELDPKFEEFEGGSLASEKEVHQKIIDFSIQMLEKNKSKYPKIPRDAHAKSHGCLRAKFIINNELIPKENQVGVFRENKSYDAYIRFSNNDHLPKRRDKGLDLRGMAIKVVGITGEKIMRDYEHELTQDFLMYGSKVFFIKDNKNYVSFIKGLRDDNAKKVLLTDQPKAAFKTIRAQSKIRNRLNPLNIDYFSATPVRLGDSGDLKRTAMKYGTSVCENVAIKNISDKKSHNYMRENLKHSLELNKEICFDFKAQLQRYPEVMPIEDSTKKWPEKRKGFLSKNRDKFSPYIKVAKVIVKLEDNKDFGSKQTRDLCEDLSFSPWHSLPEHKPLGRTMRMRRDVYRAIADFRRSQNNADMNEPQEIKIK